VTTQTTEPRAIGADDKDLETGTEIGEYRIEGVAGRGGFGTVYRAVQPVIGKQVAIKVLGRRFSSDEAVVSRFAAEAQAVNQIRHRNIIDIFSFGQLADGRHYYVMEYLDGEPLDTYLRNRGPMSLDEAIPIFRSIARALDAAHGKGIAHRDLKPENIFLANDPDGGRFPKLLDFGIAKLMAPEGDVRHRTGTGVPMGTPYYMSPEQCRGRDVDHRTDIYSFGIVIYRLLTGTYPFDGDYIELMTKQLAEEAEPPSARNPSLGPSVDRAVAWMMKKDPAQRPRTVIAGVLALQEDGTAQTTPAITPAPAITPSTKASRHALTDPEAVAVGAAPTSLGDEMQFRRRHRAKPLIGIAVLALAVTITWRVTRNSGDKPADTQASPQVVPPSPASAPTPPPPPTPPAPSVQTHPDHVIISIKGAPSDTIVSMSGTRIGLAPKVQLPYGTQEVLLLFDADGYAPVQLAIVPDHEQELTVTMKKKTRVHAPSRDDLPAFPQ
jgi:serine/threonine protein kinase